MSFTQYEIRVAVGGPPCISGNALAVSVSLDPGKQTRSQDNEEDPRSASILWI